MIPWNKGLKNYLTATSIDKMSKASMGRIPFNKGKTNIELYGIEKALELKEKNRRQAIKNFKPIKSNKQDTKIERKMENFLLFNDILYIKQWKYDMGIADFYLPEHNIIIECDGEYWHSKPEVVERDIIKTEFLEQEGYTVFRFTDKQINNTFKLCIEMIDSAI